MTEMLVVLVVIGLIAALVVPQTLGQMDRAKARTAKLQLQNAAAAIETYAADMGRYPSAEEGMRVLIEEPAGAGSWAGPYLQTEEQLRDPWGRPIVYTPPGQGVGRYRLSSLGSDAEPGGSGPAKDIHVP